MTTPHGPATFIGYFRDGDDVQVSRMVPATELSREECEARNASAIDMSHFDFVTWQKSAKFCINEVYPVGDIKPS